MNLDTEANLQGEFYHVAKTKGIRVVLELTTFAGRVDIAVVNAAGTHLLAVVECKGSAVFFLGGKSGQITRYKRLGVPVYGLTDMARVERLVGTIQRNHCGQIGVPLADVAKVTYYARKERTKRGSRHASFVA